MLKPVVQPTGGEPLAPSASAAAPGPRGDARRERGEPQRAGPTGRARPPSGQTRPGEWPQPEGSASRSSGEHGGGGSARPTRPASGAAVPRREPGGRAQGRGRSGFGARGALTSCSAQRQMSEQRPVQQPMVPAASERRARPEIRVFRRRRLLTPEQPPTGAQPPGPGSPAPRPPLGALGSGLARRLC